MAGHGSMHWRGDRTGGNDAPSAQPDSGTFDERTAFGKFNGAFPDLLGRHTPIPQADMDAFTEFILRVTYPPNPNRPLDNVLTADQEAGRRLFDTVNCGIPSAPELNGAVLTRQCHTIDPNATRHRVAGFFGTISASQLPSPALFRLLTAQRLPEDGSRDPETRFLGGDNDSNEQARFAFSRRHPRYVFRFVHVSASPDFSGPTATHPPGPRARPVGQLDAFSRLPHFLPLVGQPITLRRELRA